MSYAHIIPILLFLFTSLNLSSQEENRYYLDYTVVKNEISYNSNFYCTKSKTFSHSYNYIFLNGTAKDLKSGMSFNIKPQHIRVSILIGNGSTAGEYVNDYEDSDNYQAGTYTYTASKTLNHWNDAGTCERKYKREISVEIDDPILVNKVTYLRSDNSEFTGVNACEDSDYKILVETEAYRNNGKNSNELQIKDRNNTWQTVRNPSSTGSSFIFDLSEIKTYVDYGEKIIFRTRKKQVDDKYSTSTSTNYLYLFERVTIPGSIRTYRPQCHENSGRFGIPLSSTEDYVITISENHQGPQVWNYNSWELTKSGSYYYIDNTTPTAAGGYAFFNQGEEYSVRVEKYKDGQTLPCSSYDVVKIPGIPPFQISYTKPSTFKDLTGKDVHIKKIGETVPVTFTVSGSKSRTIRIYNGSQYEQTTLGPYNSQSIDNQTFYNGTAIMYIPAGENSIRAYAAYCYSNTVDVELEETTPITFKTKTSKISCHESSIAGNTSDGVIKVYDINGGFGTISVSNSIHPNDTFYVEGLRYNPYRHMVTVYDSEGNHINAPIMVYQNSSLNFSVVNKTAPTLSCKDDGTATASGAGGGVKPYWYSNSLDGEYFTNPVVSGFAEGSQRVYIKDAKGCVFAKTVQIPLAPDPLTILSVDTATTSPTCYGDADGEFRAKVSNVKGTVSVSSHPFSSDKIYIIGTDSLVIKDLPADEYTIKLTDTYNGKSCSSEYTFRIFEKPAISLTESITRVSDKGSATGKVELTSTVGNPGLKTFYLLDEHDVILDSLTTTTNAATFSGLTGVYSAGGKTYKINLKDQKSCTYAKDNGNSLLQIKIQEPQDTLRLSYLITDSVDCKGYDNADIQLIAEGGWFEEYNFSKDGEIYSTDNLFYNFAEGTQTFYVKDQFGGTDTIDVYFSEPDLLVAALDSISPNPCYNDSKAWVRYKISGGSYPFSFYENRVENLTIQSEDTLLTATGLAKGSHTFIIEDRNGCRTSAFNETITDPPLLTIPYTLPTHTTCELDNGVLESTAEGGTTPYTFNWVRREGNYDTAFYSVGISDTVRIADLMPGTYDLLVTDTNGCPAEENLIPIDPYTNPAVSDALLTPVTCFGEENGVVETRVTEGTNSVSAYTLASLMQSYSDSNSTGIFEGLKADNYQIYVFDDIGCRSNLPYPVRITQPEDALTAIIDTVLPVIGKGESSGVIFSTVSGGNEGLKTIILYNALGEKIDSTLERSGFMFSLPDLQADAYRISYNDYKDCEFAIDNISVIEPDTVLSFIVTEKNDALCKAQTGSFVIKAEGGWGDYEYKRAGFNGFYSFNSFENLYAGSYLVTVRDRLGATYTDTVLIYEPKDSLKAAITDLQPPTCGNNGRVSLDISGGIHPYQLNIDGDPHPVEIPVPQNTTLNNLRNGNLLIHLTDSNGCYFELESILPDTAILTIQSFEKKYPSTFGGADGGLAVQTSGGIQPLNYTWEDADRNTLPQTGPVLENIPAGNYFLEIRESSGCNQKARVYLVDLADRALQNVAKGDETSFMAHNGFSTYATSGDTITNIEIILPDGTQMNTNIHTPNEIFYAGNDTIYLHNLSGGEYYVAAITNHGTKLYDEFTIESYEEFMIDDIQITHARAIGDPSGEALVTIRGGAGETTFSWEKVGEPSASLSTSHSGGTSGIANAYAGEYLFTAKDKYNNLVSEIITIKQPTTDLNISIAEYRHESCRDYEDAYVLLEAEGGWGDYQFRQDSLVNFSNSKLYGNLPVREHYFYLIDKAGEMDSIAISITEPEYLTASVALVDSVNCKDANDGVFEFDIQGGTPPYRHTENSLAGLWLKDTIARNYASGYYTFTFTDSNNCVGQDTLEVYMPEPDSLLFRDIQVIHTTCDTDNGSIEVAMQGGSKPYRYEWRDFNLNLIGRANRYEGMAQNGYYYLDVLDAHNCPQHFEQRIAPSTLPTITNIDTTEVICYGENSGTAKIADAIAAEPFAPYIFVWSNSDTGEVAHGFETGVHSVSVIDTNNCSTTSYFEVTGPDSIWASLTDYKHAHCYGYNDGFLEVTPHGGVEDYRYQWTNGDTSPRADSLYVGEYTLVISDSNQCSNTHRFEIREPEKVIVDLGEDLTICPGNTITVDGQEFSTHRWSTNEGEFSDERYVHLSEFDDYFLEVTDSIGCYAWDTLSLSIGEDALQADFLMTSESMEGDTLRIYELSNLELDSLNWEYSHDAFTDITGEEAPDYNLNLQSMQTGVYNIELVAYSGGCISTAIKQVEIIYSDSTYQEDYFLGYQDPLITEFIVSPNPSDGIFTANIVLREDADIQLILFSVNNGIVMDERVDYGFSDYEIEYELSDLNSGIYIIMLNAGMERRQIKMVIK